MTGTRLPPRRGISILIALCVFATLGACDSASSSRKQSGSSTTSAGVGALERSRAAAEARFCTAYQEIDAIEAATALSPPSASSTNASAVDDATAGLQLVASPRLAVAWKALEPTVPASLAPFVAGEAAAFATSETQLRAAGATDPVLATLRAGVPRSTNLEGVDRLALAGAARAYVTALAQARTARRAAHPSLTRAFDRSVAGCQGAGLVRPVCDLVPARTLAALHKEDATTWTASATRSFGRETCEYRDATGAERASVTVERGSGRYDALTAAYAAAGIASAPLTGLGTGAIVVGKAENSGFGPAGRTLVVRGPAQTVSVTFDGTTRPTDAELLAMARRLLAGLPS